MSESSLDWRCCEVVWVDEDDFFFFFFFLTTCVSEETPQWRLDTFRRTQRKERDGRWTIDNLQPRVRRRCTAGRSWSGWFDRRKIKKCHSTKTGSHASYAAPFYGSRLRWWSHGGMERWRAATVRELKDQQRSSGVTERSEEVGEDVGDQLLKSVKEAAIKTSEN